MNQGSRATVTNAVLVAAHPADSSALAPELCINQRRFKSCQVPQIASLLAVCLCSRNFFGREPLMPAYDKAPVAGLQDLAAASLSVSETQTVPVQPMPSLKSLDGREET